MHKISVVEGQTVRHLSSGNTYVIVLANHKHKTGSEWVDSVVYRPTVSRESITYSRPMKLFISEFENA